MLPKKGSRRVTVDGIVYRWRESHGHGFFELRLERFEEPGQLLFAPFAYLQLDPSHPDDVYRPIMTHRVLRATIERGLSRGWTPERSGPLLSLEPSDTAPLVSDYDYRHSKWTVKKGDRYV